MGQQPLSSLGMARIPTPLEPLHRLSEYLQGPTIYVKREDLSGDIATGGNKIRKLDFLLAEALQLGAGAVVTTGGPQSNHARATAAAAARLGLAAVLVLGGEKPSKVEGNLLLDYLLVADIRFAGVSDQAGLNRAAEEVAGELRQKGLKPYVIPLGGSSPRGAGAFYRAYREVTAQMGGKGIESPWQVVPVGSGGTLAGLAAGWLNDGKPGKLIGFSVWETSGEITPRICHLAQAVADLYGLSIKVGAADLSVDDRYIGPGYGIPTPECRQAIETLARLEGILLDPVYTAKAMAGLLDYVRRGIIGPRDTVVFWLTGGATALLSSLF